ncbi:LysM domain-containing protein [Paenibacillus alvei]|uniref:LysM domain-containing protein n=1 Tax=Paenibacillus alvei TaxID=44250 RepID=A0A383RCI1_PAEAL|nr:LysM domain-containing protein [Paenibacillus alvei]SYX84006.1 conserved protein of unknown function [Paenibacillus alvei]
MINPMLLINPGYFPPTSRYYGVETDTFQASNGTKITYLRRRFIPQPDQFDLLTEHVVKDGERLDVITAQYMSDPEQFWRICDANNVLDPNELTEMAGRMLRITLPEGIPGAKNA